MTERLQRFGFQHSPYERPSDRWICGNAALGRTCRLGPGRFGRCQTTHECEPLRSGNAWTCARAKHLGGPCGEGPDREGACPHAVPPCTPRRSLRGLRGRVTRWLTAATLGLLALALSTDASLDIVHPGPVVRGHAEIADCATCHVAFDDPSRHWLLAAFRPHDPATDSKKCLACHDKGRAALYAHSQPVKTLAENTKAMKRRSPATGSPFLLAASEQLFERPRETDGVLACAACHKEHKGEAFDPTLVSNQRCQSCHVGKFASLARGHPDYGAYPYMRRTRLAFDHHKHFRKNFTDAKIDDPPQSCATCHLADSSGRYMLVKTFEQTCVACHGKDIEGEGVAGPKGIAVFSVPGLDTETLAAQGLDVGQWPDLALAEDLTPFMRLLLAVEPRRAADLERIAGLDLQDLTGASADQREAVYRVAWAVKELLFDLTLSSADTIQARLEAPLGLGMDRTAMGQVLGHIPLDVVRAARRSWFPRLGTEVPRYRERKDAALGDGPRFARSRAPRVQVALAPPDGGQVSDAPGFTVFGAILRAALGLAQPQSVPRPPLRLAQSGGDLLDRESLRLDDLDQLLEEEAAGDNSIFKKAGPSRAKTKAPAKAPAPTAAQEAPAPAPPQAEEKAPAVRDEAPVTVEAEEPEDPNFDPELWARLGGWYRQDDTLFYRPTEHRDAFMGAWLDIAAALHGTRTEPYGARILATFQDKNTPGKCTKCHSVDRLESGRLTVNWRPFAPDPRRQDFTVFNHTAHFSLVEKKGCATCHEIAASAAFAEGYKDFDAATFASNFAPMDRMVCASCHVEDSAGDACVTCHRYHVGEFPIAPVKTLIAELPLGTVQPQTKQAVREETVARAQARTEARSPAPNLQGDAGPRTESTAAPAAAPPDGAETTALNNVALQLSSLRSVEAAKEESLRLKNAFSELLGNKDLFVNKVDLAKRGVFYRVLVRPFPDPAMAKTMCDQLKRLDQDCLVVHRDGPSGTDVGVLREGS